VGTGDRRVEEGQQAEWLASVEDRGGVAARTRTAPVQRRGLHTGPVAPINDRGLGLLMDEARQTAAYARVPGPVPDPRSQAVERPTPTTARPCGALLPRRAVRKRRVELDRSNPDGWTSARSLCGAGSCWSKTHLPEASPVYRPNSPNHQTGCKRPSACSALPTIGPGPPTGPLALLRQCRGPHRCR